MATTLSTKLTGKDSIDIRLRLFEYAATHSLEELLQKTLDELEVLTQSFIGFYHFVDKDQKTLSLQAWSTRTVKEFCLAEGQGMHYSIEQAGVWVDCVHQRKPVIHNDYASLPHRKGLPPGHVPIVREMVVPVIKKDCIVAILGVGNKPTDYTQEDIDIVSFLADVAWVIVEQKQMEEALQKERDTAQRYINLAGVIFVAINNAGEVTLINRKGCEVLGYNEEEVVGKNWFDNFIPGSLKEDMICVSNQVLNGNIEAAEYHENPILTKDGQERMVAWHNTILKNKDGNIIGHLSSGEDITERKRAEEALRRARDELELRVQERTAELELRTKELEDFTFIAAHDLKEPLRKLQIFADIINTRYAGCIGEQGRDYARRMGKTAQRMGALLSSLQAYSRLTSKAEPFRMVNLKEIVEGVLSDIEVQINETKASVEIGDLPEIEADPAQLAILFQNLIGNALKYSQDGQPPRVRVACRLVGGRHSRAGEWEIRVEDNGIGFNEEYIDLIFRPFQRLHGRKEYTGVGMGLAICKKVVERHGGTITARSTPGEGSTFIVRLPRNI